MSDYDKTLNQGIDLDFQRHLELNDKIFFSGKYGMGKTMFLKAFFNDQAKAYYPIFVSPMKYMTSSNDDIFQLLKFDIFNKLLNDGAIDLETDEKHIFNKLISNKSDRKSVLISFFKALAKNAPYVGEPLIGFYDNLNELTKANNSKKATKDNIDTKFHDIFSNISLYQDDVITQTINISLSKVQSAEVNKQTILIIDDLDRLDPNDIFRMLNIFTAFNNYYGTNQPWINFNKILLVGDIKNLESIFSTRYGENTDFSGYIDKFFRYEIFSFNNQKKLRLHIEKAFKSCIPENIDIIQSKIDYKGNFLGFLKDLISTDSLNTRRIYMVFERNQFQVTREELSLGNMIFDTFRYPMLLQAKFLIWLFGNVNVCLKSLDRFDQNQNHKKSRYYHIEFLERYIPLVKHKYIFDTDTVMKLGSYDLKNSEFIEDQYGHKIQFNSIMGQNKSKEHFPSVAGMFKTIINEFELS